MSKITLKVEVSTKTKNDNYMNKLVGKGAMVQTAFGTVEGAKRTFYMFTDQANAKDVEAEIELDDFDQVKRDYDFLDENQKEQTAVLTYLYPQKA
jgi:hypothetical protein